MNEEHSKVYYSLSRKGEGGVYKSVWTPVEKAVTYRNPYGLDLVRLDGYVCEGKTGMKVCPIAEFTEEKAAKLPNLIEDAVKKLGLSPRYTRPDETKESVFGVKEPHTGAITAMDVYGDRHRYQKVEYHDVMFYIRDSDADKFNATLYIYVNGYMLATDQRHCIDAAYGNVKRMGNIIDYLTYGFDKAKNDGLWIDMGIARILDRFDEANEHNAPIRAAREAEYKEREDRWEAEERERKAKRIREFESAVEAAETAIRNNQKVNNTSVFYPESGTETAIILALMKKHGIKAPLKTQGWINSVLASINPPDGSDESWYYSYWKNNGGKSTVFCKCLNELVGKVNQSAI